jgi:DNA-binding MarR family transcriptional regulator
MPFPKKSSSFTETSIGPPLIGALLRMPWEQVLRRMLARLHEQGFDDLDAPHLSVFLYPGPEGARPSELAARLRVSKQAVNHLLGRLEQLGYLARERDPDDRRSRRVTVTRRGEHAIQTIRTAVAEVEHEWEEKLGAARFARLRGLLTELQSPQ